MNRQILISLLAALSLVGVSTAAYADDARDRNGGWKIEKKESRDKQRHVSDRGDDKRHDRDRHKNKQKHKSPPVKKGDKHRSSNDRSRFTAIERFKYDNDHRVYRPRDRHYKHNDGYWRYDKWDRHDHRGKKYDGYRARVISVVPINKVIRSGRHCRGDYGLGDWIELSLGDVFISLGNDRNDCFYIDREVRNHYRVTYIYKGRLHTARMHRHPGKYIRVNRGGNPVRGRH